ncbi:MAG: chlorophyll synthesis pathway protein BchC [Pseudomonadota bacterium]
MDTAAVVLDGPQKISVRQLSLTPPEAESIVINTKFSAISTGTEKLFWAGEMPPFPGMGYPLVPGYEAMGEVVEAGPEARFKPGDTVFVPGSSGFEDARGLFGGAAQYLQTRADRAISIDAGMGETGALLALAATARHALAGPNVTMPDLIIGHGVLGRLLAQLTIAAGAKPPVVWETDPTRRTSMGGYEVIDPADDERHDYACIYDASGEVDLLNALIGRLTKGGELVLAGFYKSDIQFAFPPAFMKELRLRIAAEWTPDDLIATRTLIENGSLRLEGLITHRAAASDATDAYRTAFTDPACLKMILNWEGIQ